MYITIFDIMVNAKVGSRFDVFTVCTHLGLHYFVRPVDLTVGF